MWKRIGGVYDFKQQVNDQRQKDGLIKIKQYYQSIGEEIVDVSENPEYFSRGIDLIRKFPEGEEYIDVKTDFIAHTSGNMPIELIEVCALDRNIKLGWLHSNIQEIIFYINHTKDIYQIRMAELREIIFKQPRKGFSALHQKPFNYFTLGILLPLEEIKDKLIRI